MVKMTALTSSLLLAVVMVPAALAYGDFDGLSTDELENLLGAIDYAGGDYSDAQQPDYPAMDYLEDDYLYQNADNMEPSSIDYEAPDAQEVPIQQRQQEILDHGTPISNAGIFIGTSGGTTKANPPKNSGAVLPAYCDPPNPCPIGYSAKDGCIEDFENTSEFSREYQGRQNCLCDSEHMFHCPANPGANGNGGDPSFLAGLPPSLGGPDMGMGHKLVAKKGLGY